MISSEQISTVFSLFHPLLHSYSYVSQSMLRFRKQLSIAKVKEHKNIHMLKIQPKEL